MTWWRLSKIIKILYINYHSGLSLVKTYMGTVTEICTFIHMPAKNTEILKSVIIECCPKKKKKNNVISLCEHNCLMKHFCLMKYYSNIAFLRIYENTVILH